MTLAIILIVIGVLLYITCGGIWFSAMGKFAQTGVFPTRLFFGWVTGVIGSLSFFAGLVMLGIALYEMYK